MTRMGVSVYGPQALATVDSIDTWVPLLTLPGSSLPDQGSFKEYTMVAWFTFGHLLPSPGVIVSVAEVSIGDTSGPSYGVACRTPLSYGPMSGATSPGRGIPQLLVWNRTAATGGTWDTANDVVLWGRINRYSDPETGVVGTRFLVGHMAILAFSHENLSATEVAADSYRPTSSQWQSSYTSSISPWNSGGTSEWLVFMSCAHAPNENSLPGASRDAVNMVSVDSGGTRTRIIGEERVTTGGRGSGGGFGMTGRMTQNSINFGGVTASYNNGGAAILTNPQTDWEFGIDITNAVGPFDTGQILRLETFAIRVDSSAAEGLGDFQYQELLSGPAINIFNSNSVAFGSETKQGHTLTTSGTRVTDLYVQAMPENDGIGSSWQMAIEEPGGSGNVVDGLFSYAHGTAQSRFTDATMNHIGGKVPPGSGNLTYEFVARQSPFEGAWVGPAGQSNCVAFHLISLAWNWENDPQAIPEVQPSVPAAVAIVPGRESPNISALSFLPNGASGDRLLPDIQQNSETKLERHSFETDDQTRLTWPHLLTPRRRYTLQWAGLSAADRDTLLAFWSTQANRIWKLSILRDPEALAIPVVNVSDPAVSDQGVSHTIQLEVVELIWTS